jgi:hypothetical protein
MPDGTNTFSGAIVGSFGRKRRVLRWQTFVVPHPKNCDLHFDEDLKKKWQPVGFEKQIPKHRHRKCLINR